MMIYSRNSNNIIQAVYPILYDMYRECCKKSRGNKRFSNVEADRDTMFCVGEKLYALKISMEKEHHQLSFSAIVTEFPNKKGFAEPEVDEDE